MTPPRQYETNADRQRAYRQRANQTRISERTEKGLPAAPPIPTMPGKARWQGMVKNAKAALNTAIEEMQAYYDERSERWQESERANQMLQNIEELQEIVSNFDTIEL